MAAPTLSHSAMQGSLKNQMRAKQQQQKKKKKMVLCTPYVTHRISLPEETQEKILQKLVEAIKPLGIAEEREERRKQKILNQQRLRKERKVKQQDQKTDQTTCSEKNLSGQGGRGQSSEETEKRERGPESETDGHESTKPSFEGQGDVHSKMSIARRKICFGINEVIKGLEKDQMRLVLACQSCKPEMLTQHMIGLAATRNCPATIISNLSTTLCPILKISSLMALGIKKSETEETSPMDEAVEFVSGLIPGQTVPWIEKLSSEKGPITDLDTESGKKVDVSLAESASTTVSNDTEPLNTQKTAPDTDYSRFYVYKNSASNLKRFGADFIPFSNESATKEVKMIPDFGHKRKHEAEVKDLAKFRKYQSTGYMPVFGNEQKVKKSKKRKRNKNK